MVAGKYRRLPAKDKARILAESFRPGVAEVARRNGLSAQRLYSWRSQARAAFKADGTGADGDGNEGSAATVSSRTFSEQERSIGDGDGTPRFVPVMMAAPASSSPPSSTAPGTIEIVIANTVVRVNGNIEAATLTTVLAAIKEAS